MISLLGRSLVLAALAFATVGCVGGYVAGSRRNRTAWIWARNSAYGFSASMLAANLLMMYALVVKDFSVSYVAEVGSQATPTYIAIISLWSSLTGSILFWGGVLGGYTALTVWSLGEKYKEYSPWALHVLLGIAIFFSMLVGGIANPFAPTDPTEFPMAFLPIPDGRGPNPLLQNHWLMAVHPPTLYLGYVGMSVPYSLICAALLAGRLEAGWMDPVRRWMLVPWGFLSVGIVLGGWWSYAVLGWGGAWAWDPVENASFHPWLTGTAFLHSAMVLQRRGKMRDWTLVLGMATFLLTLLGTFMTRSGVFNSVHSFTQSEIGPVFLVFIGVILVYSVVLLAFRSHLLEEESQRSETELGSRASGAPTGAARLFSREFAMLVQNMLFAAFTFTVLLGTLFPLITEAFQERRVSVGAPYFDKWALPIGLGIVFMMGVGPALPWGRTTPESAGRRVLPAVGVGAAFATWSYLMGFDKPGTVLALFMIGFALWGNLYELIEPVWQRMSQRKENVLTATTKVVTRARRRFGGHVAHYGVLFAVFSLALSKGYRYEEDFTLAEGQMASFAGFEVTYAGSELVKQPQRESLIANFDVTREGSTVGRFGPRMNYYPSQREPIVTPDVLSRPSYDLYFSLIEVAKGDGKTVVVRLIHQPYQMWLWWSAPIVALGTLIALWPQRERERAAAAAAVAADAVGASK
jgi:cytochrome c-type biogenesis protein CcmF